MRLVQLKKWLRVAIPLLLVSSVSLVVFSSLYRRNDTLKSSTSPHTHHAHHGRLAGLLRDMKKTHGHPRRTYKPTGTKPKTSNGITLGVVEEHHEVIPYWFKAARMGIMPKSGNTLIHIDGHSDMAIPRYDPKMPFFRWPNTMDQLHHMMQANDVFIQAAAMSGLISRIIFISPSWDTSDEVTYYATKVDIGTTRVNNVKEPVFCSCEIIPPTQQRQCVYEKSVVDQRDHGTGNGGGDGDHSDKGGNKGGDKGGDKSNSDEVVIDNPDDCKVRRHYYSEQAVDHVALKMLKTKRDWIGASGNIILDVDEDYFGVELPAQSLVDAGLDWNMVAELHRPLANMFCPKHIDHEGLGNRMMRELIGSFINRCRTSVKSDHDTCPVSIDEIRSVVQKVVLAYWNRDVQLFCPEKTKRLLNVANELTDALYQFKLNHLRALMEFGFCLETSSASAYFREMGFGSFGLCQGANTPNDSAVFLHKPDAAEIRTRTSQLREILEIIDARHRPNVVTLCRSVRDGYTPRSLFSSIESNILDIFKELPGQYDVVYDENLYGGQGGWPDRHKAN